MGEDRGMVAAMAAGDPDGIAAAYDTYAETVYGYCRWMLREPAEAAEAVRDTFVIAAAEAGRLPDPGILRSWFFATARGECLRRPSLARGEPVDAAADGAEPEGAYGAAGTGEDKQETERAELRALIPAALAELEPKRREAVVLNVWHDLDDADLAAVFGVSRPEAYAMASGGRRQLERSLGALRIARAACPELGTLLADWDGQLAMAALGLARKHVERCRTCAAARRGKLLPEALARLLPLPALPATLRERVLELCAGPRLEAIAHREQTRHRAGWSKARSHPRRAAAVALVAVAAAVSVPVLTAGGAHAPRALARRAGTGTFASAPVPAGGGASAGTGAGRSPSPGSRPTSPAGLAPSAWPPPEPSPARPARPSGSPSAKASPSSSPPSPSASSSPPPAPTPTRPAPSRPPWPAPSPSPSIWPPPSPSPSSSASATSA